MYDTLSFVYIMTICQRYKSLSKRFDDVKWELLTRLTTATIDFAPRYLYLGEELQEWGIFTDYRTLNTWLFHYVGTDSILKDLRVTIKHANIHGQVTSLHPLRITDRSRQTTIIKGFGYRYKVSPQSTNKLFQSWDFQICTLAFISPCYW